MPAQSGVWLKLYPCSGSQMPCSQMISMNCMPPRPRASIRFARLPQKKARILNSDSRNNGSAPLVSTTPNRTRTATPPKLAESTPGVPAVGQQAVGDADQDGDQPGGEQDVAPPVHPGVLAHPDVLQHEGGPHGAERADRRRD